MGFTFNGVHTSFYGLFFVPESLPQGGKYTYDEYSVSGVSGTVEFAHKTQAPWTLKGTLYYQGDEPASQQGVQTLLNNVVAWLTQGRCQFKVDWRPDVYFYAQVENAPEWSEKSWMEGGLSVVFKVQPFAHAVQESSVERTVAASDSFSMQLNTQYDSPAWVRVRNLSEHAITGITVTIGGKQWVASGLSLAAGKYLFIDNRAPATAYTTLSTSDMTPTDALPYFTKCEPQFFGASTTAVAVAITYADGATGSAEVKVYGRGLFA